MALYPIKIPSWVKRTFSDLTWEIQNPGNQVYLTFDDGPHPEISPWVLDQLESAEALGTFFCIGDNVRKYPDTFQRLRENNMVGNHTFNHLNGWRAKNDLYYQNIESCQRQMGVETKLFRPPYGRIKPSQAKRIAREYRIIMWDLLSGDFDPGINARKNADRLVSLAKPGSIIVFHDSEKAWENLKVMLPIVIRGIKGRGLDLGKIV